MPRRGVRDTGVRARNVPTYRTVKEGPGRRERLHDRLREVRAKLAAGRLEGVRLENSRLKITPYDLDDR